MQETNNSKSFQWVLAGALVLIALFVVIMLVNVKSQAEDTDLATTTLSVTAVAPSVSDIKVVTTSGGSTEYSTGASGVTPGVLTTTIYVKATITDNNGIGDVSTSLANILTSGNISAFEMQVYHNSTSNRGNSTNCLAATAAAGGTSAADDQNNCYSNGSINTTGTTQGVCTLLSRNSTISMTVQCPFIIAPVANATDASSDVSSEVWKAGVLVVDDDSLMNGTQAAPSFSSDFDIVTTSAIGFSATWSTQDVGTIDYGTITLGTQSASIPLSIYNYGNDKSTVTVAATNVSSTTGWPTLNSPAGYAMDCSVGYIEADDQVYSTSTIATWGTGTTALTIVASSALGSELTLPYRNVSAGTDLSAEANSASDTLYWMLKTSSTAGISGTCTGSNSIAAYPL